MQLYGKRRRRESVFFTNAQSYGQEAPRVSRSSIEMYRLDVSPLDAAFKVSLKPDSLSST